MKGFGSAFRVDGTRALATALQDALGPKQVRRVVSQRQNRPQACLRCTPHCISAAIASCVRPELVGNSMQCLRSGCSWHAYSKCPRVEMGL